MKHYMKLQNDPFTKIKSKTKTIEMRLNDEKRRKIKIHDLIEFTNIKTGEKLFTKVINLHYYNDFDELYKNHDKISIGYSMEDIPNPSDMSIYYNESDIKKYGTLAIEINVIPTDIDIKNEAGTFKLRTAGIIIKGDKVLVSKAKKFKGFIFPGGHVMLGELSSSSIKREIKEELNCDFELQNLFCIHENVYESSGKISNEICYYYKVNVKDVPNTSFVVKELDNGQEKIHEYCWIKTGDLIKENVRPLAVSKLIIENKNASNVLISTDEGIV